MQRRSNPPTAIKAPIMEDSPKLQFSTRYFLQACLRWKKQPMCFPPPAFFPKRSSSMFIVACSKLLVKVQTLIFHFVKKNT